MSTKRPKSVADFASELNCLWRRDYTLSQLTEFMRAVHHLDVSRESVRRAVSKAACPESPEPLTKAVQAYMRRVPIEATAKAIATRHAAAIATLVASGCSLPQVCGFLASEHAAIIKPDALRKAVARATKSNNRSA